MKPMDAVHGQGSEHEVVQRENDRFGSVHGVGVILLAAAVALTPYVTARFGFRGFVGVYAIAVALWLPLRNRTMSIGAAIVIAIALRAPLVVPDPLLSGDVYRYLSDGRAFASGINPYAYTPSDPRVNHREIRSIYPPHAQFLFAAVHELIPWRLLIVLCDLGVIVLLRERGFAYATCPLVLFEGTWSGHIDAIAAMLVAYALVRRSGVALGLAGGMKIIPLAAAPALFGRRVPLGFLAAFAIPFIPFLRGPIMPGFRHYATRWIFNSPLYELVFAIVSRIPTKTIWTYHPLRFAWNSDWIYRHVYPDFMTRFVLAVLAITGILLARRVSSAIAILLVCSPAIHPWYWLTLISAALLERSRWLFVALLMPLSYLLYTGVSPYVVWALYATSALSERVMRRWSAVRADSPS